MEKEESIKELRTILPPGTTVYCVLRHVSRSGMFRRISLFTIKNNKMFSLDYLVTEALGKTRNKEGIPISGCGMDMGFSLVHNLGGKLYPEGFELPKGKMGRNGDTSGFDRNGGYALNHEWM